MGPVRVRTFPGKSFLMISLLAHRPWLRIALVLLLATSSRGQSVQGSIAGFVTDTTEAALPGVALTATNLETLAVFTATSGDAGFFSFPALPPGNYQLEARREGFSNYVRKDLAVTVSARMDLQISLPVAGRQETVVVRGEAPLLESTRSQVSSTLRERSISGLPVNGRSFIDFALLTPGVNRDLRGGLSFGGMRNHGMNALVVDGADNNNTHFGQTLAGVGFPSRPPYQFSLEAVQEFQVITNSYSAEFGRSGGGLVHAITKSGGNDFHGSAFWHYRDRSLNANDLVSKLNGDPKPPYHFHQFGGSLGGPVMRKKLFFFLDYEGQRSRLQNSVVLNLPHEFTFDPDPSIALFQQTALNYLVPRAAPWILTSDQNVFLVKADWQFHPAHRLTARWNRQRFGGEGLEDSPPAVQDSIEHTGLVQVNTDTLLLSLTSAPAASSRINVLNLSYVESAEPGAANSPNPEAVVLEQGQVVLNVGRLTLSPRSNTIRRLQVTDTLAWVRGRHLLKLGGDLLWDRITVANAGNFAGSYRFNSLESFGRNLTGVPAPAPGDRFAQRFSGEGTPGSTVHPGSVSPAIFVQDEWRVQPQLTLNFGLRYDLQVMAQPPLSNPSAALAAAGWDTGFRPLDGANFAPRVGFAWSPSRAPSLVLRGGFGFFYGYTPSVASGRAHSQNGITVQTRTFTGTGIPLYPNSFCGPPDASVLAPSCAPPLTGPQVLTFFDPEYRQPLVYQGSLGLEMELRRGRAVSASYLFVRGTHLPRYRDANLDTPATATTIGIADTDTVLNFQRFTLPRPLAEFDQILLIESHASSIYHALAVQVNQRFTHKFQWMASYTLSKVIDDAPDAAVLPQGDRLLSDASNPRADRSAGLNDQRHRLALSGIWNLDYAGGLPRVPRSILGGWELSAILTAQSGQPYSGMVTFDLNNDGNVNNDRTPGLARNTFYLPATISFDPRLTRSVRLSESARLQLAWEAFNLFNRGNISRVRTTQFARSSLAAACGVAGTPCLVPLDQGLNAFGVPTATSGARIMQLSARLVF